MGSKTRSVKPKSKTFRKKQLAEGRRRWIERREQAKAGKLTGTKTSQDVKPEIYLYEHGVNFDDAGENSSVTFTAETSEVRCSRNGSPLLEYRDIKQEPYFTNSENNEESDKNLANVGIKKEVDNDTEHPIETQTPPYKMQCRVCLDQCDESTLKPLFSCDDLSNRFHSLLLPYLHDSFGEAAKHLDATNAPDKICLNCAREFEIAEMFINKAIKAEGTLRQKFRELTEQRNTAGTKPKALFRGRKCKSGNNQLDSGVIYENRVQVGRGCARKYNAEKELVQREASSSCPDEGSPGLPDQLTEDREKCAISNEHKPNITRDRGGVGELCENCGEILTVSRYQHYKKSVQCNKDCPKCKECGKCFRSNNRLIRHMAVHTGELSYHCNLCPMKYKHEGNLQRHLLLHTEGNVNVCDACGKSFSTRHYMMVHRRIHVDPSLAKNCDYCAEKLENQQQLDHHIEDKHIDKYIEDQFATGQHLPAILQCRFCVRKFFDPTRHLRHERIHCYSKRRARAKNANKTYVELNEQKKE